MPAAPRSLSNMARMAVAFSPIGSSISSRRAATSSSLTPMPSTLPNSLSTSERRRRWAAGARYDSRNSAGVWPTCARWAWKARTSVPCVSRMSSATSRSSSTAGYSTSERSTSSSTAFRR